MISCSKDVRTPNLLVECYEFDFPEGPYISYLSHGRFQFQTPCFNPDNANEFIFNYRDNELKEFKLLKFNIQTQLKTEIANNIKIITQPKWSRNGEIAFDNVFNQNYQIWTVNDNGTGLNQFTNNQANLYPVWGSSGDTLIWQHSPVLGIPYYLFKQATLSSAVDTIMRDGDANNGYSILNDISVDNKLISNMFIGQKSYIGFSKTTPISFVTLLDLQESNLTNLTGLCWSNDSQVAYFTEYNNGLFKLDVTTGRYTKLIGFCDSKRYKSISCSNDGKKLVAERVDSYLVGGGTEIRENSSIYIIDLETLEEIKIELN